MTYIEICQCFLVLHELLHLLQHDLSLSTFPLRELDVLSQELVEVYRLWVRECFSIRSAPIRSGTWSRGRANKLERDHFRGFEYNALLAWLGLRLR